MNASVKMQITPDMKLEMKNKVKTQLRKMKTSNPGKQVHTNDITTYIGGGGAVSEF
jgi:hypothetical protein